MDNDNNNLFLIFDALTDRETILDAVQATLVEWVGKTCEVRRVSLESEEHYMDGLWGLRLDILEDHAPALAGFDIGLMRSVEDHVQAVRIGPGTKAAESMSIDRSEDLEHDLLSAQRSGLPLLELYRLNSDAPWDPGDLLLLRKASTAIQKTSGMWRK